MSSENCIILSLLAMSYLHFGTKQIDISNTSEIIDSYNAGYVLTRISEAGEIERVRSLRVDLNQFGESSENRRILRKYEHPIAQHHIPFPNYAWQIHKLGKDFYDTKFGTGTFSANKIKELFTSGNTFNTILTFGNQTHPGIYDGYCIAYSSPLTSVTPLIHYAYPFYNLNLINSSFGIFMMTKTLQYFKELGYQYVYLGSVHSTAALYKLQFKGSEWWDEESMQWSTDLEKLKQRVRSAS